jgi:hypothetical protein
MSRTAEKDIKKSHLITNKLSHFIINNSFIWIVCQGFIKKKIILLRVFQIYSLGLWFN